MTVYKEILNNLLNGDARDLTSETIANINRVAMDIYYTEQMYGRNLSPIELEILGDIIHISNIVYNNSPDNLLVLDDGFYDLLLEKYKTYVPNFQVGAEPVQFHNTIGETEPTEEVLMSPYVKVEYIDPSKMMFYKELTVQDDMTMNSFSDNGKVTKRLRNTSHKYPKLVGTLDKNKFVLNQEAIECKSFEDPNVKIFERDFLYDHVRKGIVNPNNITLVLELKYDGVSIEAEVTDHLLTALTRGDTAMDKATDLTPILNGYPFNKAKGYKIEPFGMKFEAIINKYNLQLLNRDTGKNYCNPRNAIIGILGNGNARELAKYITLVPLATSHSNMNRIEEIEFMNKYYSTGEMLRYAVVSGDYNQVLYQVNKFVKDAEIMRDCLPFMYDGVVVSYLDNNIREYLGRKNHVNKYSVAIKFNTKKKLTRVRDVTFTVGANGDITPMIWYDPVEFYGNIQTKSSAHSYGRFIELNLRPGDVIQCEYRGDVMTYVTKANVPENYYNPRPLYRFIDTCPECGGPITTTDSNAMCKNMECPGRKTSRITNMLEKLGFKGFAEETVKKLNISSFYDLMTMTDERALILGEVNCDNLMSALCEFSRTPITDYNIVGSLGFTGIAKAKWKAIFSVIPLKDVITLSDYLIMGKLSGTKGIGDKTAGVIVNEREYFMKDLLYIYNMPNVIFTNGNNQTAITSAKTIRFTGVRDPELMASLNNLGHDCSEGSVTKKTNFLIVPFPGFDSTKTRTAQRYNETGADIKIITLNEFKLNQDTYLGEI